MFGRLQAIFLPTGRRLKLTGIRISSDDADALALLVGQVSRTLMCRPSGIAALVLPPFGDDCVGARGAHGFRYASYDMGAGIVPNILRRGARGSPRRSAYRALHRRI